MKKGTITRTFVMLLLLCFVTSSCFNFSDEDAFTEYRFKVTNRTQSPVWFTYEAESRLVDRFDDGLIPELVVIDTALLLPPGESIQFMQLQFQEFRGGRLDMADVISYIRQFSLQQIDGMDTLPVNLDHSIEGHWTYSNTDPLPYTSQITHNYELEIRPFHLD